MLLAFDEFFDKMSDEDQRKMMECLVSEVYLHPKETWDESKNPIKCIKYAFPVSTEVLESIGENIASVETVVCLGREFDKSKEHVCLDYEPSPDIEATCTATYAEIKEWVIKEYGLKVSSLYVAQVKQKHGIIERENYNKPKAEGGKVPHCPLEKEAAIEAALRYFRMV